MLDFDKIQKEAVPKFEFKNSNFGEIISALLPFIFTGAGLALLMYLFMGGLEMMTSRGDPKAIASAQGKITNALIGFIIVFASFWIVQIVGRVLGVEVFKEIFG